MKDLFLGILLVLSITFGALCLREAGKERTATATVAALRQNASGLEERLQREEQTAKALRRQLKEAAMEIEARAAEAAQARPAAAPAGEPAQADDGSPAKPARAGARADNPFADMLQKPEVKEMVRTQQKMVFSGMIDKNYAELFSSLGLSPEQSASLKDLVLKKMLVNSTMGVSLLGSDVDAAKRAELLDQAKADKDALNEQIHQFLGDDNYKQFQTYEKSQPERMGVSMFKDQLASGANALRPDQEASLVQVLTEERQNFKFTTDFSDEAGMRSDPASYFSEDRLSQYRKERDQLDERYLARAQTLLSPDQITAFKSFLSSQNTMQEAGMKLAAKMFAPSKPGAN